jgi:hypothetical protein
MGLRGAFRGWVIAIAVVFAVLIAVLLLSGVLGDEGSDACSKFSADNCAEPQFSPER